MPVSLQDSAAPLPNGPSTEIMMHHDKTEKELNGEGKRWSNGHSALWVRQTVVAVVATGNTV